MMFKQRFLLNQPINAAVSPLEDMFEQLAAIDEETWGLYEFSKDMLRDKVSDTEKLEIIRQSLACGQDWAQKMRLTCDNPATERSVATELAHSLGLSIEERPGKATKFRMVFAQFIAGKGIEVISEPVENYEKLVVNSEKLPHVKVLKDVLIAHEIFHFLEEQHKNEMYPYQKTIKLWKLFGYEHRSTVGAASEIAAMAFAKEICGIDFVPQVLDVLLSYGMDIAFSMSIYEQMMSNLKLIEQ
ncbi:MAG: hypothetical protein FWE07_07595 [Turicibacter sp.]|nr:hypothetical protein [Turicibacter sp.]